jgi:hypothetical protein
MVLGPILTFLRYRSIFAGYNHQASREKQDDNVKFVRAMWKGTPNSDRNNTAVTVTTLEYHHLSSPTGRKTIRWSRTIPFRQNFSSIGHGGDKFQRSISCLLAATSTNLSKCTYSKARNTPLKIGRRSMRSHRRGVRRFAVIAQQSMQYRLQPHFSVAGGEAVHLSAAPCATLTEPFSSTLLLAIKHFLATTSAR